MRYNRQLFERNDTVIDCFINVYRDNQANAYIVGKNKSKSSFLANAIGKSNNVDGLHYIYRIRVRLKK